MSTNAAIMSTDEIYRGDNTSCILSDELDNIESDIANHTHSAYMTEEDAADAFALANHTHTDYASTNHTHSDYATTSHTHSSYETALEALDDAIVDLDEAKASASHTHAQSEITGLSDKLTEIETAISALQSGSDATTVEPMLVANMHLGKLDNNNGSESTSSTRICSDPIAIESGKSYWQVNDDGVNMYVLIYDADELFLEYMGSYASGAEIEVTNADAAYMRLGSLIGNYDLTNEYRIYDQDPAGSGTGEAETFTQADADLLYAPITHTHSGYAAEDHTHTGYATTDHTHSGYAATDHTHTGYAAASHTHTADDITGLPSSVDAYSKTEADERFATASHTHSGYAATDHTHSGYATTDHTHSEYASASHTHSDYAAANHTHSGYAASSHTHTYSDVGAAASNHTHTPASIGAASSSHTHSEYASASHTHSGYASSNHTHNYLPLSGGTVTGEVNFSGGLIRVGGQQSIYDSGTMVTLSTNNRQTMIAGSAIYSKQTIQVSSDERLKENIKAVDPDKCVEFINGIDVKTFNYIGDDKPCMGVIAQDVQNSDLAKFFVSEMDCKEKYLAVKASDLVFPLIAAVQELTKRVEMLEAK